MWAEFDGKPYTREKFVAMVKAIPIEKLRWVKYLTVHNTALPTIAQWVGPVPAAQRIINLQRFYEKERGWRSGPHGFIPPSKDIVMWGFTPFHVKGVHASCFNGASLGFEMVGDFDREDFNSGLGAVVRDNTIFVLAVLYRKLGLRPDDFEHGVQGLHFHIDCGRDNHACPGSKVRAGREAFVQAILRQMDALEAEERQKHEAIAVMASSLVPDRFAIPAADGPKGYFPADPAPPKKPNAVKEGAASKTVFATLLAAALTFLQMVAEYVDAVISVVADTVVGLFDSAGDVVKDIGENIELAHKVAGWLQINWKPFAGYVTLACFAIVVIRHIAKRQETAQAKQVAAQALDALKTTQESPAHADVSN